MRPLAPMLAAALLCVSLAAAEAPATYKVIVNPQNEVTELDRKFVADAFLKKTTRWPNDELIRPVDLPGDSVVRERFSSEVMSKPLSSVKSYWQQLIFSGRGVPPPEVDSDEAVIRYVLKHRAAIGYVSASADPGGAKVVSVR